MVPPVPAVVVGRVVGVAVLLLLEDERPLLVELDLTGVRGKKPRARRGVAGRARRPAGRSGPRCCGSPSPAGRWRGRRCARRGARRPTTAFSSVSWEPNRGVPLRSENRSLAGAAVEQPALLVLAVAGADGQVADPPLAVVGAVARSGSRSGTGPRPWRRLPIRRREEPAQVGSVIHTKDLPRSATLRHHPTFEDRGIS